MQTYFISHFFHPYVSQNQRTYENCWSWYYSRICGGNKLRCSPWLGDHGLYKVQQRRCCHRTQLVPESWPSTILHPRWCSIVYPQQGFRYLQVRSLTLPPDILVIQEKKTTPDNTGVSLCLCLLTVQEPTEKTPRKNPELSGVDLTIGLGIELS